MKDTLICKGKILFIILNSWLFLKPNLDLISLIKLVMASDQIKNQFLMTDVMARLLNLLSRSVGNIKQTTCEISRANWCSRFKLASYK